jgi:hypothetical protein
MGPGLPACCKVGHSAENVATNKYVIRFHPSESGEVFQRLLGRMGSSHSIRRVNGECESVVDGYS